MDSNKVDMLLLGTEGLFPEEKILLIRDRLLVVSDEKWFVISTLQYKKPMVSLAISYFAGYLGADRFYMGDLVLGILKLLTCGGCGIWWFIDLFLVSGTTKNKNYSKLSYYL